VRFLHPAHRGDCRALHLLAAAAQRLAPAERKLAIGVLLLLALQCGLGVADVALLAPVWMQIVHLLGADLLWIALVVLTAESACWARLKDRRGRSQMLDIGAAQLLTAFRTKARGVPMDRGEARVCGEERVN
jgi:hypothetical protein